MYYPLNENISSKLEDMALNLCYSSTRCTEWALLYSGIGIYNHVSSKEMKRMFSHFKVKSDDKFLDLLHFIKCIYKKGRPDFLKPLKSSKRDRKYIWKSDSFNKEIPVLSQSFGILSLCTCSRLIKHHEKRLSLSMLKAADLLFDFTVKNMKSGEGHFVSFENKANSAKENMLLKRCEKHPNTVSQVFLHEAFLTLYFETYNAKYKNYFRENSQYLDEAKKIFKYLFDNHLNLITLNSRDLSNVISSLYRCCALDKDDSIDSYRHLIAILAAELDSRVRKSGEVERNENNDDISSTITHFRSLGALIESNIETGIDKFKDSAEKIFSHINELYDIMSGMFISKDEYKINYTLRDISDIIRSLFIYYTSTEDDRALEMLKGFYKTAIEESSIIASTPERKPEFLSHELKIPDCIPLYEQNKKAPVFLKGFKINTKKSPYPITSKSFNSYYGLYSSYIFSFYFTPIIEHKKRLRGEVSSRDTDFLEDIFYNVVNQNKYPSEIKDEEINENIGLNILD
ncbi:hypothetical protein [Clostridium cylindrosporum]|uniref:Uncharacterized protein n=1 Tax=Clostridium cylindrosporum DSM 605 TaxID=1121307 RepID=A0A0J8DGA4_CLOCY|nr:hypothetical protein [Clostridium cylindrosporum]KMT23269.1 hypothetical protein CLCY_8c00050 [Clostridium cylindrosporum DSM 605]